MACAACATSRATEPPASSAPAFTWPAKPFSASVAALATVAAKVSLIWSSTVFAPVSVTLTATAFISSLT